MRIDEILKYLPQLAGKKIKKICYCEPQPGYERLHNLYFEFDDGSHFEMYADAEMRFTAIIEFDPHLGSIVERTFTLAKTSTLIAAKVDESGIAFSDPSLLLLKQVESH